MEVYVATQGEYSDYAICQVFARREDAETYRRADRVEVFELREGPVVTGTRYTLNWRPDQPDSQTAQPHIGNPWLFEDEDDLPPGRPTVSHSWSAGPRPLLHVEGFDRETVTKVYREQRAKYEAQQAGL